VKTSGADVSERPYGSNQSILITSYKGMLLLAECTIGMSHASAKEAALMSEQFPAKVAISLFDFLFV